MRKFTVIFASFGLFTALPAEGGEGGAIAGLSAGARSYRLMSIATDPLKQIDAPIKQAYIAHAFERYSAALAGVESLQVAIAKLLVKPNSKTLIAARLAWVKARPAYLHTEVFRYVDGPIDAPAFAGSAEGPEARLNAWPVNEAVIDYVAGAPDSGIVQNLAEPLTEALILSKNQVADEADVTTGWHAVEFLLWGQDFSAKGAGNRKASDFALGSEVKLRRREYLRMTAAIMQRDLAQMVQAWTITRREGYAAKFAELDSYEAIGRMLTGMATLASLELASERLLVALDSGTQEDEHSCFSDTSSADLLAGVDGIALVLERAGLLSALQTIDPAAAVSLKSALQAAQSLAKRFPAPFDQMLATPEGSAKRLHAEKTALALQNLASELSKAGRAFGVLVSVAGVR